MTIYKKPRHQGLMTAFTAALLLAASSASAITVNGDLTDIVAAVGAGSVPLNAYTENDPRGNTESTEDNNGFDINNVYSLYDVANDTLYLGMSVYGTVGDSRAVTDTALYERTAPNCNYPGSYSNACRNKFDSNEVYGFSLFNGTSVNDPALLTFTLQGTDNGGPTSTINFTVGGLSVSAAASVTPTGGVEFSIIGLNAILQPFSTSNPANLAILFKAGSGDINSVSSLAEDSHLMQTQVVPVPAAAWLLGSGLIGLLGVARKSRSNA